jgi:hypothetical protein
MQELAAIEEQLWSYIDNSCNEAEHERMETNIATDAVWKSTYQKLLSIHHQLQAVTLEQPSMRFTKNTMEQLADLKIAPKINYTVNSNIIKAALAVSIMLLVAFFAYIIIAADWTTPAATHDFLDKIKVSTVMYSTLFTIVILLLVLIDTSLHRNRQKHARL